MTDIKFENYLEDGEHILWSKTDRRRKIRIKYHCLPNVVIAIAIFLIGLIILFKILGAGERNILSFIVPTMFLCFGMIIILLSIEFTASAYFITDKRVFIFKSLTFCELKLYEICGIVAKKNKNDDKGRIILYKYIGQGSTGPDDNAEKDVFVTLYDVEEPENVVSILRRHKEVTNAYEKARESERRQGF